MALVNPQIAMSYRPTTEYQPRNALAEYAQLQSIVGAQRQAEVADMQLQRMRQEDAEIERIHQLARQYGAPESRLKMGQELFASRNPQQRELGYKIIQHEENKALFERAERNFGYASSSAAPPAAAPAAPASAPGAILGGGAPAAPAPAPAAAAAPAAPAPAPAVPRSGMAKEIFEEYGENAAKFFEANGYLPAGMFTRLADQQQQSRGISREEYAASRNQFRDALRAQGVNVDAPEFNIQPPPPSDMAGQFRRDVEALGIRMAPAAAPAANVLAAQQGATPPPSVNQLAAAGGGKSLEQLQREFMTYSQLAKLNVPGAEGRLELIKQQMEDARKAYEVGGRLVTREGKILYEAPRSPSNIADLEREIAEIRKTGAPDSDPRIVARLSSIAQISGQSDPIIRQYEYAVQKQGFKGTLFDYKREIARAGRSVTPPPVPPLEKVIDPRTGQAVFVSREEALRNRMTPAGMGTDLSPREIQKREAAFPQAKQSVSGFQSKSDQFITELERLRDDPGLNQITGPIFGRTPSVTREGSRAQALYDKIFAKGGFQALQDMREASKTGGALGNVSNEEGRRLEKSIVGGLDRTQNIADVQQAINDLIDEIRSSQTRVRTAFDETYEYRSQRGGAGAGAGGADPLGIR